MVKGDVVTSSTAQIDALSVVHSGPVAAVPLVHTQLQLSVSQKCSLE